MKRNPHNYDGGVAECAVYPGLLVWRPISQRGTSSMRRLFEPFELLDSAEEPIERTNLMSVALAGLHIKFTISDWQVILLRELQSTT